MAGDPREAGVSTSDQAGAAARLSWPEVAFYTVSDSLLVALGIAAETLLFVDVAGWNATVRNLVLLANVLLCSVVFAMLRAISLRRASPRFLRSVEWRRSRLRLLFAVSVLTALLCLVRLAVDFSSAKGVVGGLLVCAVGLTVYAWWRLRRIPRRTIRLRD